MKPIRLPEPPSPTRASVPDIFEASVDGVVRRAIVIGNGFPGSENQSLGLIRALGLADKHVLYRTTRPRGGVNEWLHWLPLSVHKKFYCIMSKLYRYSVAITASRYSKLSYNGSRSVNGSSDGLAVVLEVDVKQIVKMALDNYEKDGPLLVVSCGRDTISTASSIKKMALENAFVVQIQHPRVHLERFDLVITPHHDYYALSSEAQKKVPRLLRNWITPREPPDDHVILTVGALHQIDFSVLRTAALSWHSELAPLSKPLLVVNVGWPTSLCRYGSDLAKQLVSHLHNVIPTCGSVRISFSSKTPAKVSKVISRELLGHPKVHIWNSKDSTEPNPYMGYLAWADAFVITADSVSMISESLQHWIGESWSYPPLSDTIEAARKVHEALAKRGLRIRT